jgi:hypothetical protein
MMMKMCNMSYVITREKNATYLKDLSVKYDDALTNAGDSEVKYLLQFFVSPHVH